MKPRINDTYLSVSEMQVASWSEGEDGEGVPPTQVHILFRVPSLAALFVMRLKSRAAVDGLITALIEHRDYVFGNKA